MNSEPSWAQAAQHMQETLGEGFKQAMGAFSMGVFAGKLGVGWNLGFLAETERQVEAHLEGHLCKLPKQDAKSRAIVAQMKADEASHAETAVLLGARELPRSIKAAMKLAAGLMTRIAYYV